MITGTPNTPPSLTEMFLGDMHFSEWVFSAFLMLLGVSLYIMFRVRRKKDATASFLGYFRNPDNKMAIPITIILTYLLIRFYSNYKGAIEAQLPEGLIITEYFGMVVVGFCQHYIAEWLGKKAQKL